MSATANPCLSCGACCAYYRITFHADEALAIPAEYLEQIQPEVSCMKGTNNYPPRCSALRGEVGQQVSCAIYEDRPSPCREFNEYELDGTPNMRCFKLRGITPPATI
jgi:Fe-S-cluster containining protein